jgi:hypothetical protein
MPSPLPRHITLVAHDNLVIELFRCPLAPWMDAHRDP